MLTRRLTIGFVGISSRDIPYGKNVSVDEVCDDFDPTKPIYFLVHGFVSNANYTISYMLSKALIQVDIVLMYVHIIKIET